MKTILLILLPFLSFGQFDLTLEYFKSEKNALVWQTSYESGKDTFYIYQSRDAASWELIGVVESKENLNGSYYRFEPTIDGRMYYKLYWVDGFSYAVIDALQKEKKRLYNILGQQTTDGWRF